MTALSPVHRYYKASFSFSQFIYAISKIPFYLKALYLHESEYETGGIEDEEDQNQRHHGAGQLELLPPPTVGPVEPLGLGYLGVNLHRNNYIFRSTKYCTEELDRIIGMSLTK